MVQRRPLVLVSGAPSQLPPGDTLLVPSGTYSDIVAGSGLVGGGSIANNIRLDVALASAASGLIFTTDNKLTSDGLAQATADAAIASGNAALVEVQAAQASGNAAFTQRNITVGAVKYQDTLCPKALRAKWTQILLKQGSNAENEELTFATQIGDMLVELIKENVEVWDWQGDSGVVGFYDGLIKLIDAATTAVDGNTGSVASGTGIVVGNVVAIINAMCDAVPAKLKTKSDKVLFVGTEVFDIYVNALITANLFAVDATTWSDYVMTVPGKNVKVVGVHGLDATNRMFLGRTPNFHLGVDMENEEEEFKIWYSQDDDNIKYSVKFKRGVQVAYPSEIVEFTLTA